MPAPHISLGGKGYEASGTAFDLAAFQLQSQGGFQPEWSSHQLQLTRRNHSITEKHKLVGSGRDRV